MGLTDTNLAPSPYVDDFMSGVFDLPETPNSWAGSPMDIQRSESPSPHSSKQHQPVTPEIKSRHQQFLFVDQTPEITPTHPPCPKRRKRGETPIDMDKSRIAQQRRRDTKGQFIRKEVAARLEELETKLEYQESECEQLRKTINERDAQVELLKEQLRQLVVPPPQYNYGYVSGPQPYPVQTTARNYILVPSPNPGTQFAFQGKEAFKKKIDYSKIQLRKTTSSLDEEKREVLNSQEEWAYRQNQQQFIRKLQEDAQWHAYQHPHQERTPSSAFGGAPSNIYPETLNKVGNLPVSAFTTKINLEDKRQRLGKRERSAEKLINDDQREELMQMIQARIRLQEQMKFHPQMNWHPHAMGHPGLQMQEAHGEPTGVEQQTAWQFVPPYQPSIPISFGKNLGGPPSNIYPPPEKIGNLQVPAFTTKVDYSEVALKKRDS